MKTTRVPRRRLLTLIEENTRPKRKQFPLRIDTELLNKCRAFAEEKGKSLNAVLCGMIELAVLETASVKWRIRK